MTITKTEMLIEATLSKVLNSRVIHGYKNNVVRYVLSNLNLNLADLPATKVSASFLNKPLKTDMWIFV